MARRKQYYAVARGRKTGIFSVWSGNDGAEAQVRGYPGACYKGFATREEARQWLAHMTGTSVPQLPQRRAAARKTSRLSTEAGSETTAAGIIEIYTDGGCSKNPGPGGYGIVMITGDKRVELSGGFRHTTNNRMELTACIEALRRVPPAARVRLYCDSQYVVNALNRGWAKKWRAQNWMRTATAPVENYDLWEQLLELCDSRQVEFVWVKGHAGTRENERCDQLAAAAMMQADLLPDRAYEQGLTRNTTP